MCQNAQDSISLDLPLCWQCKNGTPFVPMGGRIRMTHCTTQGCCNAHSDVTGHNNTHQHTPTHSTPCAYGHSQRCTKCSRRKMAQHMEQQDLPQDKSLNTSHVHVSTTIPVPNAHVAAPRCICICMVDVALAGCRRKPLTV